MKDETLAQDKHNMELLAVEEVQFQVGRCHSVISLQHVHHLFFLFFPFLGVILVSFHSGYGHFCYLFTMLPVVGIFCPLFFFLCVS